MHEFDKFMGALGAKLEANDEGRRFVCGTRAVKRNRPGDFRVICATCDGGGTISYPSRSLACSAAVRDSAKPCPARPSCGAM